ncbi:MAG: spermidine synthase [Alphaproteobacteria bacterium]
MFVLQLMVGKMLLPLTGGTPAGWIVAMAFFQLALLGGYALACWLSRFPARVHGVIFILVLAAGAINLPVSFPHETDGTINAPFVLRLLTLAVSPCAIALAATSSTIQRLFASTRHTSARDPYFLYAAGNIGSMAGLLLYPFAIETALTLPEQSYLGVYAYGVLVALCVCCVILAGGEREKEATAKPVTWENRLEWAMLAFFPSSLLLGVTMHITSSIIAAPLIWVLPMSLYFLTYVLGFSKIPGISGNTERETCFGAAIGVALAFLMMAALGLPYGACWHLLAFTIVAYLYHARLANLRPVNAHLTDFYLMIAAGGAAGGILNAFLAPLVFSQLTEYPIVGVLACLMHPALRISFPKKGLSLPRAMIAAGATVFFLIVLSPPLLSLSRNVRNVAVERNFFGIIRIYDIKREFDGVPQTVRVLQHGTTTHGLQFLSGGPDAAPVSYYAQRGPLGDIFSALNPRKIAVIGLGTGIITCYAAPGRDFTFFEIDPAVISIARTAFTYLDKCANGQPPRIVEGDGRLELAKRTSEKYDLIILDAFSSDMVPAHLLTREAIALYMDHLNDGGALAFHISNRYVRLQKLLAAASQDMRLSFRWRDDGTDAGAASMASTWAVIMRRGSGIRRMTRWESLSPPQDVRPWTDDYSSILSVFDMSSGSLKRDD